MVTYYGHYNAMKEVLKRNFLELHAVITAWLTAPSIIILITIITVVKCQDSQIILIL